MSDVRCVSVLGKHQVGHILSEKAVSMAKLDFNHTNAEYIVKPPPTPCVLFLFLVVQIFGRLDPPPDENSWIRA